MASVPPSFSPRTLIRDALGALDSVPSGYDKSPDYGGREPSLWPWLVIAFSGLAVIAVIYFWRLI